MVHQAAYRLDGVGRVRPDRVQAEGGHARLPVGVDPFRDMAGRPDQGGTDQPLPGDRGLGLLLLAVQVESWMTLASASKPYRQARSL